MYSHVFIIRLSTSSLYQVTVKLQWVCNWLGGCTVSVLPPEYAFAYIHTLVCSELQPSILYRGEGKNKSLKLYFQRPHSVHIVVKQWMLMSKSTHSYQIALWHPWYSITPHTWIKGVPLASTFARTTPNESFLQSRSGSPYNLKSYCSFFFLDSLFIFSWASLEFLMSALTS